MHPSDYEIFSFTLYKTEEDAKKAIDKHADSHWDTSEWGDWFKQQKDEGGFYWRRNMGSKGHHVNIEEYVIQ